MIQEVSTDCQQRLEQFFRAVEAAQQLQDNILNHGLLAADFYCEDVDSNWLEVWDDEEQEPTIIASLTKFLSSNDVAVIQLRELSFDKSLKDIALELEKCLSLPMEEDKIFAVKTFLVDHLSCSTNNHKFSHKINLLELAENLVKKAIAILGK
ncbi:MAG: hypothetical protein QNJ63_16560 [Calothrix sp. MO_192.B10]|nr:hypothetical protein [Calothrix sp. MO_192.B10]